MARPRRSTSAAPAEQSAASSNGRSTRPRVSNIDENAAASKAKAPAKRGRSKTPAADAEADSKADSPGKKAPAAKRPRMSMLLKAPAVPANAVNQLTKPFGLIEDAASRMSFDWPLVKEVDPRSTGKPLSVFVVGTGDFGQLGLGTEGATEAKRPRLHTWFEKNSQPPATEANGEAATNGDAVNGEDEDKKAETSSKEPKLGKYGVEDIACGGMHSLVVDSNGTVWTWGINDNGALGRLTQKLPSGIDSDELEYSPMEVPKLQEDNFRVVRAYASDSASLALSDKGQVRVWGSFRAKDGLLGFDEKTKIQTLPVALPGMAKHAFMQIACGENHVLLLTCAGHVYSFGNGESGQLGRHSSARRRLNGLVPERIGSLSDIVHIAAGDNHSFAVKKDGTVYGWGLNLHKQLGIVDADEEEGHVNTPIEIEALDPSKHSGAKVVEVGAGTFHSVFLFDSGEVFVCGCTDEHEVGLADDSTAMQQRGEGNNFVSPPVKLPFPTSQVEEGAETKIVKLGVGTRHSFALSKTGELYAWGLGSSEQLGCNAPDDAGESNVPTPRKVVGKQINPYRVVGMSTGGQHSVIVAAKVDEAPVAAPAPAA